ncbi:MAG: response regulator [Desulfobacteraceae bacterium]|nr:response regulator [Desulfobacteraceae bacterium]MBC2757488.1 response regulator [Desulfobacteraceae bacterium]
MTDTQPLILIVDDNPINIDLLLNILKDEYRFGVAKNGAKALAYLENNKPDLILLDVMMPEIDGFEVCAKLKADQCYQDVEVIFITALSDAKYIAQGFETGAVDYITKPFKAAEVKARVQTHMSLKKMKEALNKQNIILEDQVKNKTAQLQEMFNATVGGMALMAESRDPYTAGHQHRVAEYASDIAKNMGLPDDQIEAIRISGLLHDIGKIRTPVSLLNRPGKLLKAEWELIKTHPAVGFKILKQIPFPWPIAEIVYQHHERIDGSGYPRGLKGDETLLEAKILAVADVIEAISSHRPYRPALSIESAFNEVKSHKGKLFDETVVDSSLSASKNNHWETPPAAGPIKNEQTEEAEPEMYSATNSNRQRNFEN